MNLKLTRLGFSLLEETVSIYNTYYGLPPIVLEYLNYDDVKKLISFLEDALPKLKDAALEQKKKEITLIYDQVADLKKKQQLLMKEVYGEKT